LLNTTLIVDPKKPRDVEYTRAYERLLQRGLEQKEQQQPKKSSTVKFIDVRPFVEEFTMYDIIQLFTHF